MIILLILILINKKYTHHNQPSWINGCMVIRLWQQYINIYQQSKSDNSCRQSNKSEIKENGISSDDQSVVINTKPSKKIFSRRRRAQIENITLVVFYKCLDLKQIEIYYTMQALNTMNSTTHNIFFPKRFI